MDSESVLKIVKQDLMITSNVRDEYLTTMIQSCKNELANRGVALVNGVEDTLLLADYVAFRYRHRTDDAPLPKNLQLRIQNKKVQGRLNNV